MFHAEETCFYLRYKLFLLVLRVLCLVIERVRRTWMLYECLLFSCLSLIAHLVSILISFSCFCTRQFFTTLWYMQRSAANYTEMFFASLLLYDRGVAICFDIYLIKIPRYTLWESWYIAVWASEVRNNCRLYHCHFWRMHSKQSRKIAS